MQNFAFFNAFSIDPSDACVPRAFVRASNVFRDVRNARGGVYFFSMPHARARVSFFKKFLISFRSFRLNTSRDDDGFHSNRNAFFVCTSTSRDPSKPTNRSRVGSARGLGLGLAWIHFFLHFGARVIHPSIHRASCVEGGTATATPTVMPPVMPRRRRRRRNGGGGTFRDGEDDGAGGVTRRTNA